MNYRTHATRAEVMKLAGKRTKSKKNDSDDEPQSDECQYKLIIAYGYNLRPIKVKPEPKIHKFKIIVNHRVIHFVAEEYSKYESSSDEENDSSSDDEISFVPPRETHPFRTEVPLLGGNKNKRKPNMKRKNRGRPRTTNAVVVIPPRLDSFSPNSLINTLKCNDSFTVKTNPGQQFVYWRFKINDLFDPDPLIGSASISGYAECAGFYRRYLVLSITIDVELVNNEIFPVIATFAPSDIDLASVITSPIAAINISEYPLAKRRLLAPVSGMNRARLRFNFDLAKLTGQHGAYMNSLAYSAITTTSPTSLLYFNLALASGSGSNFTALGVVQFTTYKFRVKWTQRQTPQA